MAINKRLGLYWHTARYLKTIQIANRVLRKLRKFKTDTRPAPVLRIPKSDFTLSMERNQSQFGPDTFRLLNCERTIPAATDWNHSGAEKLWLYNLHYFDDLNAKGRAARTAWHLALIDRWVMENPPGHGNGWEPYPLSLRIVNWVKWALGGNVLSDRAHQSLAVQARALRAQLEYHLLGNHLLTNGKALVFAGSFFEGREAESWFETGMSILSRELDEQILADGGHFELSPVYHAIVLEDLLDLINLAKGFGSPVPQEWTARAEKMLKWLKVMSRPDGQPVLFNDGAFGIAPRYDCLAAYAAALDQPEPDKIASGLTLLRQSGYFRFESDAFSFFGDVARPGPDYIPGHAHADVFTFELCAAGQPIFVDTGTSTYETCPRRLLERGTAAHNTVQLGDLDQSEVWGSFRMARRARVSELAAGDSWVEAGHDGYRRVGAYHRRRFEFSNMQIRLEDTITRTGCRLPAVARFHCAPGLRPYRDQGMIQVGPVRLHFTGHRGISLAQYFYAPEFNILKEAVCIEIEFAEKLRTDILL